MPTLLVSVRSFALLFLGLGAAASANARQYCQSGYGLGTCPSCSTVGRTYEKVGGIYCTVCYATFCNVSYATNPAGESARLTRSSAVIKGEENEPPFLLQAPQHLLYELANIHPEAAILLYSLDRRSLTPDAVPPARGDGGSDRLMTPASVLEIIRGQASTEAIRSLSAPLPMNGASSRAYWELERKASKATLLISHQVVDANDEVVAKPYPDIEIRLERIEKKTGFGYWIARSWAERTR